MAYIHFSLLHIPAIVVHGNSLTLEEWDHWATPAHILGFWDHRLKNRNTRGATDPMPSIADVQPASAEHLTTIVEARVERAEQMELFA